MFRLTSPTLCVALAIATFPAILHAQFLGLQSEVYAETDLGTTYRVYAEFADPADECIAVYSVGTAECVANDENDNCIQMGPLLLELDVTTAFYQHPAGSNMGSDINPVFFSFFPEMAYDSWLTIGSSSNADEAVANIGMTSDLAEFNAGSGFVMDGMVGGSWYVTPGTNPAATAGADGLVLLGQFTALDEANGAAGHVSCLFNIQWRNASGVSFNEMAASLNTAGSTTVSGCMDSSACNYNSNAVESDGLCAYATGCDSCSGATDGSGTVVDGDSDNDGVCDANEIPGCQTPTACNYNASATDSAACLFAAGCDVCTGSATDGTGSILDLDADNDGVCDADEVAGCQNPLACNYNAAATDPGVACVLPSGCVSCSGALDGTGYALANDDDGDGVCNADEVTGCQNSTACNYNAAATDSADCTYPDSVCDTCSGETDGTGTVVANDADGDGVCDADEVPGCQDASACNFNSAATDAGTCIFATGCDLCTGSATDGTGSVLDLDADNDGVCDADEVSGCQNASACNYNASATNAGACIFATGCDVCDGNATDGTGSVLDLDADDDGVCNADEVSGCQNVLACNYNSAATDAGETCAFPVGCESCSGASDGTGYVLANDDDGDGVCNADEIVGCQDSAACNYHAAATDAGSCTYAIGCETCSGATDGTGTVIDNDADDDGVCNADEIMGCQDSAACNYDAEATDAGMPCIYATGCETCSGAMDGTGTVIDNDDDDDGVCNTDEVADCQDPTACNYNAAATDNAANCIYASGCDFCSGATDGSGSVILGDSDGDGVCDVDEFPGCQDPFACNYNASATDSDGSCTYEVLGYDCDGNCLFDVDLDGVCDQWEITGCQDASACNYDATATDAGYCVYADAGYDCSGNCLNDVDGDGVCDGDEVMGCADSCACNYNTAATDDDGSCTHAAMYYDCAGACLNDADGDGVCDEIEVAGCTGAGALNFNPAATDDDGTCLYCEDADGDGACDNETPGCINSTACNYNSSATVSDGSCVFATGCDSCSGATNGTGTIIDGDSDNDGVCDLDEVAGCQVVVACNYNPSATDDDGSCTYAATGFNCDGSCLFDTDADGVCDQEEVVGCQDMTACNYDAMATDAGYCDYPELGYDCAGTCLNDTDGDGVCDAFETAGCTDGVACNFDANATDDNGSCNYTITGFNCDGSCLLDEDNDGICDQNEIIGCQDVNACNYDDAATDAGYCDYPVAPFDCSGDCVNDADGDGICDEFGAESTDEPQEIDCSATEAAFLLALADGVYCGEGTVWVPALNQCILQTSCLGDFDFDGVRGTADLLIFLSYFGFACE